MKDWSRRAFLTSSATSVGGLLVSFARPARARSRAAQNVHFVPNPFVQIDPDGTVHIWAPRADVGQGTRTSLPMLVAEELEADWPKVVVHQADLNNAAYGEQDVGGSDSVLYSWTPLRQAGAIGRELLLRAAAKTWQVPATECVARASVVSHPNTGRSASYGSLALVASRIPVPNDPIPLKPATSHRLLGKEVKGVDNAAIVTGRPIFGIDVFRLNMRYAAIARCPSGGKLVSYDDREARAIRGVRNVLRIDGLERSTWLRSGVAVVADCTWTAIKGRNALHVVWDKAPEGGLSSEDITARLRESALHPGTCLRHAGDVDTSLKQASYLIDVEYELPLVAHVPMEPMNCTAHVVDGQCDVWGPIQMPDGARTNVARAIRLPKEAIAIHPTRIGGSFGRRLASDYAAEAAYISKAIGDPVQVIWTREDDLEHDFYRPAAYHHIRAGMSAKAELVAWRHRISSLADSMYPTSTGTAGLLGTPKHQSAGRSERRSCPMPHTELSPGSIQSQAPRGDRIDPCSWEPRKRVCSQ